MSRSLSVDAGIHRRPNPFFSLSRIIRNIQNDNTDRLRWRRLFLNVGRRLLTSNLENKLREASIVYRERKAFKKVVPKLKKGSMKVFDLHQDLDRKDMMKLFSENIMKTMIRGHLGEAHKVSKAMEYLPSRK